MNTKHIIFTILAVIVCVLALGYAYSSGTFTSPIITPNPTLRITPTQSITITPTITPIWTSPPTANPPPTEIASTTPASSITSPIPTAILISTSSPTTSPTPTPSPSPDPAATPPPTELRIFVASSLVNVVQNASKAFEAANNCKIIVNSGGSNSLYQQIIAGSPCNVFMSADFKWTKQLNASGLLYNNYQNFTTNSLEVLLPKDNPKNIVSLLDLLKPGVKIVIAYPSVPAGSYTNTTLTKIDATWGNSSSSQYLGSEWKNYRTRFLSNVVSYELTVEDVVGKVSLDLGIADAGVAFASDGIYGAMTGSSLQYIPIASAINTRGTYGIAVIGANINSDLAVEYMNFWLLSEGQNLLQTFGFGN